jgi:hypothetical protein
MERPFPLWTILARKNVHGGDRTLFLQHHLSRVVTRATSVTAPSMATVSRMPSIGLTDEYELVVTTLGSRIK